jgi:hypothetical protein
MADPQEQRRSTFRETPGERLSGSDPGAHRRLECVEWCPICRAADVLRANAPPELRDQWQTVQREALLTTRAMIDTYLERLDGDEERAPRVQDIPIE